MKTLKLIAILLFGCFFDTVINAQFLPFAGTIGGYTPNTVQTIGIGTFPTINDVQSHLHVNSWLCAGSTATPVVDNGKLFRTDGDSTFDCQWESWTGTILGTTLKGRIFVPSRTADFEMECSAYVNTAGVPSQGNIYFNTPAVGGGTVRRVQINGPLPIVLQQGQTYNRTGYVGLNVNPASMNMPVSLLTLDGDAVTDGDAYRPWMKIGTYIGNNTDNMYVGMLDNLNGGGGVIYNRSDAVIAWGNDSTMASSGGPDVLRFIFTNPDTVHAGEVWGSEAGRWEPNGNFGVGDFRISGFVPHNRIEDYTWLPGNLTPHQWLQLQDSTGQFRLTYNSNQTGMLGTHTDFQEDSIGDLLINPQDDSTPRFAGIGIRVLNAQTGVPQGPQNTLEIMSGWHSPYYGSVNGSSGLKFRNMNATSTPISNPGPGLLALDATGNLIYVDSAQNVASIGTCASPNVLNSANGAFDLNNAANFYFFGNGAGTTVNNVSIGLGSPGTCPVPPAKLTVLQESGSNNSIGMLVASKDFSSGTFGAAIPTIGIKSLMPAPPSCPNFYNVAGWFQANYTLPACAMLPQYAVFIPQNGGTLAIGFPFSSHYNNPNFLIDCSSRGRFATYTTPSDSSLKTNIRAFNSGLNVIRKLNMVSYKYNGLAGFDTSGTFYGVIAQNVQSVAPYAVISSLEQLDSTSSPIPIKNIDQMAIMYTAINAIKQLDSTVTSKNTTIDSLRTTLDSLRSAVQGMQNCLNRLCGNVPVHPSGGNGNSGDSNSTITNTQDVMLSAATNTPLLYQNIPNPFSTGTKINYYLPEGIIGATMVFYDTYGNQLKSVPLSQTGNGTLNITPDNLSAGIYSYSMIVNNNIIDTKRMLLQK